jgi:hypothetical protein
MSVLLEQEDLERVLQPRADGIDITHGGSNVVGLGYVHDAARVNPLDVLVGVAFQGFDHGFGHDGMALVVQVEGATLQQS